MDSHNTLQHPLPSSVGSICYLQSLGFIRNFEKRDVNSAKTIISEFDKVLWKRGKTHTRVYSFSCTASNQKRMPTVSQVHKDGENLMLGQRLSNKIKFPLSTEIKLCTQQNFLALETMTCNILECNFSISISRNNI